MSTQRFVDALSGPDGTQALRVRYQVPPVYPDATVPVVPVRPATVPDVPVRPATVPDAPLRPATMRPVPVRIPEIDPQVARTIADLVGADRPAPRAVPPGRRPDRPAPRAAAPAAPTRSQAARTGYYQGPTPDAVAPAEAARHHRPPGPRPPFPAPPARPGALGGSADRVRAQLGQWGRQFGTGNPRTRPAVPSSPQQGRRSTVPASVFQPQPVARRRANTVQVVVFLLFFLLVLSGLGAQLVDVATNLFRR